MNIARAEEIIVSQAGLICALLERLERERELCEYYRERASGAEEKNVC